MKFRILPSFFYYKFCQLIYKEKKRGWQKYEINFLNEFDSDELKKTILNLEKVGYHDKKTHGYYIDTVKEGDNYKTYTQENIYLGADNKTYIFLKNFLKTNYRKISSIFGSKFRVVNIHIYITKSDVSKNAFYRFHTDDLPSGYLKIMIYPFGVSKEIGTTEFKVGTNKSIFLEGKSGMWVLFDPNKLMHRGNPPTSKDAERYAIVLTLGCSHRKSLQILNAGCNAFVPKYPWKEYKNLDVLNITQRGNV